MSKLGQGFHLDLAHAFSGHTEQLSDFFERSDAPVIEPESESHDFLFAAVQFEQRPANGIVQQAAGRDVDRYFCPLVFDDVRQAKVVLFADGLFQ